MAHIFNRYWALKSMYRLNSRMSWLHRIHGIDISRCFEYTEAYIRLAPSPGKRVLDIGSYRSPFPAFLIQQGYHVSIIDIDPTVAMQKKWIRKALTYDRYFLIAVADGICLPFPSGIFDKVTCISTLEHLSGNGDIWMMQEISRVLRVGGRCFISVPYATVTREGKWGKWFQRWYNVSTALSRLVKPSGLYLIDYGFLMGGKVGKMVDWWYTLPRLLRHALSWSHIFLFHLLFEKDAASQGDARVLWLLLEKNDGS